MKLINSFDPTHVHRLDKAPARVVEDFITRALSSGNNNPFLINTGDINTCRDTLRTLASQNSYIFTAPEGLSMFVNHGDFTRNGDLSPILYGVEPSDEDISIYYPESHIGEAILALLAFSFKPIDLVDEQGALTDQPSSDHALIVSSRTLVRPMFGDGSCMEPFLVPHAYMRLNIEQHPVFSRDLASRGEGVAAHSVRELLSRLRLERDEVIGR